MDEDPFPGRFIYRFQNFDPAATVIGVFGDPRALVIGLRRRGN